MGVLTDLMDALAEQIKDELDTGTVDYQVLPRLTLNPTQPCIDIYPADPFQQGIAFGRANNEINLTVRARINTPDDEESQNVLLDLMDPFEDMSLAQAILSDTSLGSTVEDVAVIEGPSQFGVFPDVTGSGAYLGCTWTVRVTPAAPEEEE